MTRRLLQCLCVLAVSACRSSDDMPEAGGTDEGSSTSDEATDASPPMADPSTEGEAAEGGSTNAEPPGTSDGSGDDDTGTPPIDVACKRGIAYGYHSAADMDALSGGVHWWYNWAFRPDEGVADDYAARGFEYVPMVWGGGFDEDEVSAAVPEDATALLGFNEPNFFAQANLSPEDAAAGWPALERIADTHGLQLVSPAVNFCGGGCWDEDPFAYLDAFFAACGDCRVDALAVHWYACDGPALQWYLGELERFGLPIWLTEFSCGDGADLSVAVQMDYMEDALAILEDNPRVERYAWFAGRTDAIPNVNLLAGDGELTELGALYVSAPASEECAR